MIALAGQVGAVLELPQGTGVAVGVIACIKGWAKGEFDWGEELGWFELLKNRPASKNIPKKAASWNATNHQPGNTSFCNRTGRATFMLVSHFPWQGQA